MVVFDDAPREAATRNNIDEDETAPEDIAAAVESLNVEDTGSKFK